MFLRHDTRRNEFMLKNGLRKNGYDWWWHSFTGHDKYTGEEKSFFIEFFTCNPDLGGDKPVFGQLEGNKANKIKPSYVMVKAGAWGDDARQLHRFFAWNEVSVFSKAPFSVFCQDCELSETYTKGTISITQEESASHPEYMCDFGEMSWELKINKKIAFNVGYGASKPLRDMAAFEMFWHAEGMKTEYEGTVIYNGREYIVSPETSFGYADKNWGKNFTSPWVWLSSCNLESKITGKKLNNSVFDIGGGRPKIGPFALKRKLLSAYCYEGSEYEFNFSKFWTFTRTEFLCRETDTQIIWHVEQKTLTSKMVTDITCEKSDMLLVNYESPDGQKRHNRLWNGGNGVGTVKLYSNGKLVDEVLAKNVGCEYGEYTS